MLGVWNLQDRWRRRLGHSQRLAFSSSSAHLQRAAGLFERFNAAASDARLVVFDFDGVFTSNMVYVSELGVETVRCSRADGIGVARLSRAGIRSLILSTEVNSVVAKRAQKLQLPCVQGCADKLAKLNELLAEWHVPLGSVAFLGNDVNDAACLQAVGLPAVVADAHEDVVPLAIYRTSRVGGNGAVREFCDVLLRARLEP